MLDYFCEIGTVCADKNAESDVQDEGGNIYERC